MGSRPTLLLWYFEGIAVTTMDVSSKDFSLNFRGFEHDDPETVQRFTAFCEANFALSPENLRLLQNSPETIVLTHGGSVEELEALAKVLREIGALVDVSSDRSDDISSLVGGPSTQELHRLFRGQSASENDDTPNSCPYPPPLGRSLYVLSNSEAIVDRRALRQRVRQSSTPTPPTFARESQNVSPLVTFSGLSVAVGIVMILAAFFLVKRDGVTNNSSRVLAFQNQQRAETLRREATKVESGPAKTLSGATSFDRFAVELKVLASPSAVSISSLTFTPTGRDTAPNGIIVRRIVGEPTFLREPTPGTWGGAILLSVFIEQNGVSSHFTVPASISVIVDAKRASLQVAEDTVSTVGIAVSKSDDNTYSISGLRYVQMPLS